jgi:hypothetical protein
MFWKTQVPLALAGIVTLILAFAELWRWLDTGSRRVLLAALVLFAVSLGFFFMAATARQWCAPSSATHGTLTWGNHPWYEPTLWDCLGHR